MASKELTEEVRAAEAAVAAAETDVAAAEASVGELEQQAAEAKKPAAVDKLAATLAAARGRLDVLRLKLTAALDFQRKARERAEAEAHARAIKELQERKATLEAAFAAWGDEKERVDARAKEMRAEFGALLEESDAVASADHALHADLGPVEMGPVCGELWARAKVASSAFPLERWGA